jgi:hypothetical protein
MKWFQNAYDRAGTAEFVLQAGLDADMSPQVKQTFYTDEYSPGFYRASWSLQSIGSVAIMNYHPYRMVYNRDEGYAEPIATPFYRVHLSYRSIGGEAVTAMIEFDDNFAYVKRSSEYANTRPTRPDEPAIWDEAMAALDESLLEHAVSAGRIIVPPVVEKVPAYQMRELALAS